MLPISGQPGPIPAPSSSESLSPKDLKVLNETWESVLDENDPILKNSLQKENPSEFLKSEFYLRLKQRDENLSSRYSNAEYNRELTFRLANNPKAILLIEGGFPTYQRVHRSVFDIAYSSIVNFFTFGKWKEWKNQDYVDALNTGNYAQAAKAIKAGANRLYPLNAILESSARPLSGERFDPFAVAQENEDFEKKVNKLSFLFAQLIDPPSDNHYRYELWTDLFSHLFRPSNKTDRLMKTLVEDLEIHHTETPYDLIRPLLQKYHIVKVSELEETIRNREVERLQNIKNWR